jgi:hypothetical protein
MERKGSPAYPFCYHGNAWQIAIPLVGKLAPLVWKGNFPSRDRAAEWLQSETGGRFVAAAQKLRRLPEGLETSNDTLTGLLIGESGPQPPNVRNGQTCVWPSRSE